MKEGLLNQWRQDTPNCENLIHFNNAGASLTPKPVLAAMHNHLQLESGAGGYEAADKAKADILKFYEAAARLLNCHHTNIAFTSSATNSFARALSCIPFKTGDKIVIANEDYISNQLAFLSIQKRFGIEIIRAASLPDGGVDPEDVKGLVNKYNPVLVSISHIPTNSGLVQPVEEIGRICLEKEITYLVDACQSAGQLPLDVNKIHCDFLTATYRKFLRGPRGAGFLFVSDRILKKGWEPLFIDMRGANWTSADQYQIRADAIRFEDWEIPYALMFGAKAAMEYALDIGLPEIEKRNSELANYLRNKLIAIGLPPLDLGKKLSAIVTVHHPIWSHQTLMQKLHDHQINASISHGDFALIDFRKRGIPWALRLSPHYYNTISEIDRVVDCLKKLI
jgi:selenocysteine lyase/cysteine desulfurase